MDPNEQQALCDQETQKLGEILEQVEIHEDQFSDVDQLLQQLREIYDAPSTQPAQVEECLADLRIGDTDTRCLALEKLSKLNVSNREIVQALIATRVSDRSERVKGAAEEALQAPAHQRILAQNPRLRWTAAVKAIGGDDAAVRTSVPPLRPSPGRKSIWTRLDESDNKLNAVSPLIVITCLAASVTYGLYEAGKLWIILVGLLGLIVLVGLDRIVHYKTSKCSKCHRAFAAELVDEDTIGKPRKKRRLVSNYGRPAIQVYYVAIVDKIYRCKYCGHRWRVTRKVEQ